MIFKITDKATENQLPVIIPKFLNLRRSFDLVKIIHGKMGQDEFTRDQSRDEGRSYLLINTCNVKSISCLAF